MMQVINSETTIKEETKQRDQICDFKEEVQFNRSDESGILSNKTYCNNEARPSNHQSQDVVEVDLKE
jgi:hypothetical protein